MTVYTKTMAEALAEVRYLLEDNMDLMRKAVTGSMQTLKMKDGKLKMDKVTASAIMQILDKVNPANKKKMEKMINDGSKSGIIKLSDFAMSKVTGFKSEEAELDEHKGTKPHKHPHPPLDEIEEKEVWDEPMPEDEKEGKLTPTQKAKAEARAKAAGRKYPNMVDNMWASNEEFELDEKTKWKMGDGRPRGGAYIENERFWDLDIDALKYIMKDADTAMKANPTGRKAGKYADEVNDAHTVIGWRKKNGIKEEVDLRKLPDMKDALMQVRTGKPVNEPVNEPVDEKIELDEGKILVADPKTQKVIKIDEKDWPKYEKKGYVQAEEADPEEEVAEVLSRIKGTTPADQGRRAAVEDDIERAKKKGDKKEVTKLKEDEELDEGKMKELHGYIEDGKSAEWIAKKMGVDVKTIKALMSEAYELGTNEYREYIEKLTPGETEEVDEASARADAKRSMKSDPSMSQDPFSKDDAATDDDVKGASKNIIMQMRKAVSMRGDFKVEFGDGKKVKIPAKVGQAVQDKFNSIKKPADKERKNG